MDPKEIVKISAVLDQVNELIPCSMKWVTKSIGVDSDGKLVYMRGKSGPDWDYNEDPYAILGAEVTMDETKWPFNEHNKLIVTELREEYVEGYLVCEYDWDPTSYYKASSLIKIEHDEYHMDWANTNEKKFVSDKPRMELTVDGIYIWNGNDLQFNLPADSKKESEEESEEESDEETEENIQRYQNKKRCRSVLEVVKRKPKQAARKTVMAKVKKQQNWGSMRKNKNQKANHP